jgi:tryptophan 2,3-dioxygenase
VVTEPASERLTYGDYLRIPELLELQVPYSNPAVHGEMLFIILQQAQELWFKQILHELKIVVGLLPAGEILAALPLLDRVNRIVRVLSEEAEVMETLPPLEFQGFRGLLKTASGFESEQFRELELVSGLEDEAHLRLASRLIDVDDLRARWPLTLRHAFNAALSVLADDPVEALVEIYGDPGAHQDLFLLAEAMTEYELRFNEWRFHHLTLVERVIGTRATGTGGSSGSGYLGRTLAYRFFPELWEARNQLVARVSSR